MQRFVTSPNETPSTRRFMLSSVQFDLRLRNSKGTNWAKNRRERIWDQQLSRRNLRTQISEWKEVYGFRRTKEGQLWPSAKTRRRWIRDGPSWWTEVNLW